MDHALHPASTPPGPLLASLAGVLTVVVLWTTPHAIADTAEGIAAFTEGNYERAYAELKPEAEDGDPEAQYYLGSMYYRGFQVEQNFEQAAEWFRKAAALGNEDAQASLGYMYANGRGVPHDGKTAADWYRQAAENGHAVAQRNLAVMYQEGRGVQRDYEQSVMWFRKAAEQGDAVSQTELAHTLWMGYGSVNRDRKRALEWIHEAAQQDHAKAQYLLCGYLQSLFHQDDDRLIEAFKWCKLSADQGYPGGQQDWEDATRWFINDAQKNEAARRASEWAEKHRGE